MTAARARVIHRALVEFPLPCGTWKSDSSSLGAIKADGVGEVHELDNVNAPAAALHAGDKGL
jgi:hypothetical protein